MRNSATLGSYVSPGDIRYRNFGDGDPNNPLISTDYDRRVLASSLPHFNYGGSVDLAWRGIDFNLTFQGVGERNSYLTDEMVQPLRSQWYNFATYIGGGNSWSRKNTIEQNKRAKYPRYSWSSANNNYAISDYWLFDGSYFRVKNISLGYTLPQQITRKAHIEKLRIYVSGENLFFWSPLKKYAKNYDPEMITAGDADFSSKTGTDGQGYGYPMTRSVTIGLNINF